MCGSMVEIQSPSAKIRRGKKERISRPKFTILQGHVEEVLLLKKFFFRLPIHALVAKIWPDKVVRWCRDGDFLRPVFAASRV